MVVVDASAILGSILGQGEVRQRIQDEDLMLPALADLECLQAIRRLAGTGRLDAVQAEDAYRGLRDLRCEVFPHTPLLPRIWELRGHVTAYDAAYIALAEALDVGLVTMDAGMASAAGSRAELFSEPG